MTHGQNGYQIPLELAREGAREGWIVPDIINESSRPMTGNDWTASGPAYNLS